ncbi:glycerophosphoryl diester phosphodiesterase membrane domain-containing protein [Terrabacter sp. 2RAF25]|uniref:glycerophosphoryl diester phosphodiesterase membrane domain-containing protein n=1 Tax=Terrabacter sp. 2RAF25 TaxID=3232998 RepID=UPI003F957286
MSDQQGWTVPGGMPPPPGNAYPPPGPDGPSPSGAPWPQASAPVVPVAPVGHAGYQPPGWLPPQLAPKPGIIPLRPLTLGEIWSGVMTAVRGNPTATIGLALVTTAIVLVPLTLVGVWVAQNVAGSASIGPFDSTVGTADQFSAALEGQLAGFIPQMASYVTALLLPLFMAVVIGQGVQGRRIGLGETARAARGRIWSTIGVVALAFAAAAVAFGALVAVVVAAWVATGNGDTSGAGLVTFLAVVVAIWLGVLFSVRWCFAVTVVVLEGAGPVTALRRSWTLTRKRGFWRIFGIRLLTSVVVGIAGSVIAVPLGLLSGAISGGAVTDALWLVPVLEACTVLVQSVLTTPFSSGVDSLLYVDQRMRYEGLDVALLQQPVLGHDASAL